MQGWKRIEPVIGDKEHYWWQLGTPLIQPQDPFVRCIVVYRPLSPILWEVLGTTTDPTQVNNIDTLQYRMPPKLTLPTNIPCPLIIMDEVDMDGVIFAMNNIFEGKMVPEECANVMYQNIFIILADAYKFDRFERARIKMYRQWFDQCVVSCGEEALLRWIRRYKHWTPEHFKTLLNAQPTLAHLKGYAKRHGTKVPRPEIFMQVAPIEVDGIIEMEGGVVWIGHLDRINWLWNEIERERQKLLRTHYVIAPDRVPEQLQYLARHVRAHDAPKEKKTTGVCLDLEDLTRSAAPCMRIILQKNAFPRDKERLALVTNMAPHYNEESISNALVTLHQREKKTATEESTLKRWDFRYAIKHGYEPIGCKKLRWICPFPETGLGGTAQVACQKQYDAERPNTRWKFWSSPSMWWDTNK